MKSLMKLQSRLLLDMSRLCCVSTLRDQKTIADRTEKEGLSFLTITLPNFARAFERSLETGSLDLHLFSGFRAARGRRLPAFLQGFVSQVFDPCTGLILDEPSSEAVFAVRQICLAFKKYRAECTPKRMRAAFEAFVVTDTEVQVHAESVPELQWELIRRASRTLFSPIFEEFERLLEDPDYVVPRHGPGATADRILANAKYDDLLWTTRLEQYFPASLYLLTTQDTRVGKVISLSPRNEIPVRVVAVPKTLKTPRIIAIEPTAMQYVQQGILEKLVPLLESNAMFDALGFSDQGPNKELARLGSEGQGFATLDLSEASDRVSWRLVQEMLAPFPRLLARVDACRSRSADVPGYGVHPLSKFASMGSALCFPIEAMAFLTIAFIGYTAHNQSDDFKDRKAFLKSVRIYGDDIIVPIGLTHAVVRELETYGLRVNQHKSFWNGKFRESCGGDYFDGCDVKPQYIKTNIPTSLADVEAMVSTVALRNLCYTGGLWATVAYLDDQIRRLAPFPIVHDTSPALGRRSFLPPVGERECSRLHKPLVRAMSLIQRIGPSPLSGEGALMKFFLKRGLDPIHDKRHLERSGRPRSAHIKPRWVSI